LFLSFDFRLWLKSILWDGPVFSKSALVAHDRDTPPRNFFFLAQPFFNSLLSRLARLICLPRVSIETQGLPFFFLLLSSRLEYLRVKVHPFKQPSQDTTSQGRPLYRSPLWAGLTGFTRWMIGSEIIFSPSLRCCVDLFPESPFPRFHQFVNTWLSVSEQAPFLGLGTFYHSLRNSPPHSLRPVPSSQQVSIPCFLR